MSKKLELQIIAISYSQAQTGAYALVLGENESKRRLPIIIGAFEAQSIAIAIEKIKSSRPLTHDLFKTITELFDITLKEVIIDKYAEGIFFAKLIFIKDDLGYEVDSRTSDAVALAIRYGCPIYTYEQVLDAAGILLESDEKAIDNDDMPVTKEPAKNENELSQHTIAELKSMLDEAVSNEEYERASAIRDEINKRSK